MSDDRRRHVPGGTYFLTVRLRDRGSRVLIDRVEELRAAVRQVMAERPFRIDSAVVLPDQMHMIWTLPGGDADVAPRWRRIKAVFSKGLHPAGLRGPGEVRRGETGIWQRRHWEHMICDEADLAAHRAWMIAAPVRAGLVREVGDWPWGSGRGIGQPDAAGRDEGRFAAKAAPVDAERRAGAALAERRWGEGGAQGQEGGGLAESGLVRASS